MKSVEVWGGEKLVCCLLNRPQAVQREVHRFRESRRSIIPAFARLTAFTLLPSRRHFQVQKANRELAARRFVLYPDSQAVQTSLVPFT